MSIQYRLIAAFLLLAIGAYVGYQYASGQAAKLMLKKEKEVAALIAEAEAENIKHLQEAADIIAEAEERAVETRRRLANASKAIRNYRNSSNNTACIDRMFIETWNSIASGNTDTAESTDDSVQRTSAATGQR